MSNGTDQQFNCILEICCCGGEAGHKRVRALSKFIQHELGNGPFEAVEIAQLMVKSFDFAERGTLKAFKDSIAKHARDFAYEDD